MSHDIAIIFRFYMFFNTQVRLNIRIIKWNRKKLTDRDIRGKNFATRVIYKKKKKKSH